MQCKYYTFTSTQLLPAHLGLVLGLLVRQQVELDEGVGRARGPVRRRQLFALDDLRRRTTFENIS